jgi:hypothetical protein
MNKEKSTFIYTAELFEFNVIFFDLTNVLATFQKLMDEIVDEINWCLKSNYLDDLIIESLLFEEYIDNFFQIFECFNQYSFSTKLSKCNFFKKKASIFRIQGICREY